MAKSPPWGADLSTAYPNRDTIYCSDEISEFQAIPSNLKPCLITDNRTIDLYSFTHITLKKCSPIS